MATDGCLTDKDGKEYDVYAVYSFEDKVYFLTIVYSDGTYTYDYSNDKWVKWIE